MSVRKVWLQCFNNNSTMPFHIDTQDILVNLCCPMCCSLPCLVQIGDHKQLRPKVECWALTVQKGDGYDLNVSLFERLVLSGFEHVTLSVQHRMRKTLL